MFLCWSVKGGSGTTVVAAALALIFARSRPTLLVDLGDDAPAVLGAPEPTGPGVADWLASPTSSVDLLARLIVPVVDNLELLPRGLQEWRSATRWPDLANALVGTGATVVIDVGVGPPPAALEAISDHSLLVTRSCYPSLRRAAKLTDPPTGVVLVLEPGRALGARDVEHAVGAPVIAVVHYDPAVARAVDSGLMSSRLPRSLSHALRAVA